MSDPVSVSRTVAAPAETVWSLISDVTRMGEWSPETISCRWIGSPKAPEVGARFIGANCNGWRRWWTMAKVTEADPGRRFSFEVSVGPVAVARWSYSCAPDESSDASTGVESCVVTETWIDRRGGLAKALGNPLSGVRDRIEHNRAGMAATLERLAAAAEAAARP